MLKGENPLETRIVSCSRVARGGFKVVQNSSRSFCVPRSYTCVHYYSVALVRTVVRVAELGLVRHPPVLLVSAKNLGKLARSEEKKYNPNSARSRFRCTRCAFVSTAKSTVCVVFIFYVVHTYTVAAECRVTREAMNSLKL